MSEASSSEIRYPLAEKTQAYKDARRKIDEGKVREIDLPQESKDMVAQIKRAVLEILGLDQKQK